MTTPLAHAGHWYHALLYIAPVVLVSAALWWSGRRGGLKRQTRELSGDDDAAQD